MKRSEPRGAKRRGASGAKRVGFFSSGGELLLSVQKSKYMVANNVTICCKVTIAVNKNAGRPKSGVSGSMGG